MASKLRDYILYYKKKLQKNTDEEIVLNTICKLSKYPMTCDLLQETGIGKLIRNYAKDTGVIGDKAKKVYLKWKDVVAQNVQETSTKSSSVKSTSNKKDSATKDSTKHTHTLHLELLRKSGIFPDPHNGSDTISNNVSESIKSHDSKKKTLENNASENSLYTYEKPEGSCKYIDYDPHGNIDLGYSPDYPELYPENNLSKKDNVSSSKSKHASNHKINNASSNKNKTESFSPHTKHDSKPKKMKTDSTLSYNKHTNSEKAAIPGKDVKKVKDDHLELKNGKDKSKSEKSPKSAEKKSGDLTKKTGDEKHSKSKVAKLEKSKSKLKLKGKEEFTSSEVSFEDCLGFNDMISVKKKKSSSKSLKKKEQVNGEKAEKKVNEEKAEKKMNGEKALKKVKGEKMPKQQKDQPLKNGREEVVDVSSTLPQTVPTYRPLIFPRMIENFPAKKKTMSNEEAIKFTSSRKEKTAVYSGRRHANILTEVPTLFNACIQVLIENIDAIECMGGIPYFIIKPVMERCTPEQLLNIENYNPTLLDDTQELWVIHCNRDYRGKKPDENETWRDLYMRAQDERAEKLKFITANITASMSKSNPVRKAKLAYVDSGFVKPPRDVARRQAKHGTAAPVNHTLKANPLNKSTPKPAASAAAPAASSSSSPTPSSSSSSVASTSSAPPFKKPKIAPLMAKTLKSFKQCFRR